MTETTQAALSLLERLRTLAETWEGEKPPGLGSVPGGLKLMLATTQEAMQAYRALARAGYYDARNKTEWLDRIAKAIEALKETT